MKITEVEMGISNSQKALVGGSTYARMPSSATLLRCYPRSRNTRGITTSRGFWGTRPFRKNRVVVWSSTQRRRSCYEC